MSVIIQDVITWDEKLVDEADDRMSDGEGCNCPGYTGKCILRNYCLCQLHLRTMVYIIIKSMYIVYINPPPPLIFYVIRSRNVFYRRRITRFQTKIKRKWVGMSQKGWRLYVSHYDIKNALYISF